jgi:hypothetical protein
MAEMIRNSQEWQERKGSSIGTPTILNIGTSKSLSDVDLGSKAIWFLGRRHDEQIALPGISEVSSERRHVDSSKKRSNSRLC